MLALKTLWITIKKYWVAISYILAAIAGALFFRQNTQALRDVASAKKAAHEDEIATLKASHKKALEDRERSLNEYKKIIKQLESEYQKKSVKLKKKDKARVKKIVADSKSDPDKVKKAIEDAFGFTYVE